MWWVNVYIYTGTNVFSSILGCETYTKNTTTNKLISIISTFAKRPSLSAPLIPTHYFVQYTTILQNRAHEIARISATNRLGNMRSLYRLQIGVFVLSANSAIKIIFKRRRVFRSAPLSVNTWSNLRTNLYIIWHHCNNLGLVRNKYKSYLSGCCLYKLNQRKTKEMWQYVAVWIVLRLCKRKSCTKWKQLWWAFIKDSGLQYV